MLLVCEVCDAVNSIYHLSIVALLPIERLVFMLHSERLQASLSHLKRHSSTCVRGEEVICLEAAKVEEGFVDLAGTPPNNAMRLGNM